MRRLRIGAVLVALALAVLAGAAQQSRQPILLLVSFDGWRWDYITRARAPNLRALAARGVRSQGIDSVVSGKDVPQSLHDRHGPVSRTPRHRVEQHRRTRVSRALYDVVGDGHGPALVGRRADLGHGDSPGAAHRLDVLAGIGGAHRRRVADRVEAVRRQDAERRSGEAGARVARPPTRPATVVRHALFQRGRSRGPRLRTGLSPGTGGRPASRRRAGTTRVGRRTAGPHRSHQLRRRLRSRDVAARRPVTRSFWTTTWICRPST